jgi:hypothetical protein
MSFYSLAADAMVAFHAAYVGFVVFGLLAILIGILCHWRWIGNFWFRIIHLVMISVVVCEALSGILCPLTTWEYDLRIKAGETVQQGTFIGRFFHNVLISDAEAEVFTKWYCVFGGVVLATLILAPPQRPTGPRWLVRRWERQALQGWHQRLRLHRWLSRPEVGWLAGFFSQTRQTDTMHRHRNPPHD